MHPRLSAYLGQQLFYFIFCLLAAQNIYISPLLTIYVIDRYKFPRL